MESLESKGIINYKLNCPRALTYNNKSDSDSGLEIISK